MKEFESLNKKQLLKLLAVIALSDGTIDKRGKYMRSITLRTNKNSVGQHDMFNYLSNQVINKNAGNIKSKKFLCSRIYSTKLVKKLLKLSPSYKTTPCKENKEDFLSKPQPTLSFMFNEDKKIQILALRMWFDFEGTIIPRFRLCKKVDRKYFSYDLAFLYEVFLAESNPSLVNDLIKLCNNVGFKAVIKKDPRNWIGLGGVKLYGKEDVIKFSKLGPITDVKVSKKSPRFCGFTKKSIGLSTVEILKWKKIHWSFDNEKEGLELKQELDKKFRNIIKKHN
ncbi:hypothetical protein CL618_02990 [archaeon]|nr:hypothetical protein [archaeon]|tara:strand:+ start:321 stop:1163 length:843 start_codon:yes stop_codon:yes gene_type:complete